MTGLRDSEIARDMRAWIRERYQKYSEHDKEAIFRGVIYAITGQYLSHQNGDWTELELDLYEYFRKKGYPGSFTSRESRVCIGEYFLRVNYSSEHITI
jgi:hypothetical protein